DCLILESNHDLKMLFDGPYPWSLKKRISSATGHLSNEVSGQSLLKTIGERTKTIILAHLSEENNKPRLALSTVRSILEKEQVCLADIDISTAPRHIPSRCFFIERK
ncbi:MAG: MBL fold metallo-hydrolase, partial [Desulfocucumaceae bacterium]